MRFNRRHLGSAKSTSITMCNVLFPRPPPFLLSLSLFLSLSPSFSVLSLFCRAKNRWTRGATITDEMHEMKSSALKRIRDTFQISLVSFMNSARCQSGRVNNSQIVPPPLSPYYAETSTLREKERERERALEKINPLLSVLSALRHENRITQGPAIKLHPPPWL
jgi:hypothetical protein